MQYSSARVIISSQRPLSTQQTQQTGFEPANPAIKWPQTYALNRMANGSANQYFRKHKSGNVNVTQRINHECLLFKTDLGGMEVELQALSL